MYHIHMYIYTTLVMWWFPPSLTLFPRPPDTSVQSGCLREVYSKVRQTPEDVEFEYGRDPEVYSPEHWWTVEVNCGDQLQIDGVRGSFGLTGIEPVDPAEAFPDSSVNTGDINAINIHNNSIVMGKDWCAISVWFILSQVNHLIVVKSLI